MCAVDLHAAKASLLRNGGATAEAADDVLDFDSGERARRVEERSELLADGIAEGDTVSRFNPLGDCLPG